MQKYLFLFLLFSCVLSAQEEEPPYLTSEYNTLALIEGTVNAHNGKLVQIDHDIEIQGSEPLELIRFYDGGHNFDSEFGYGVGCSHPALLSTFVSNGKFYAGVEMRMGCEVLLEIKRDKSKGKYYYSGGVAKEYYKSGYSNCCEALLRGEPSLYTMHAEVNDGKAVVTLGNGAKRHYELFQHRNSGETLYLLKREDKSNGNKLHFSYNFNKEGAFKLKRIWTTNSDETLTFNWMDFVDKDLELTVTGSNGQKARYIKKVGKATVRRGNAASGVKGKFREYILDQAITDNYPATQYEQLKRSHYISTVFSVRKIKRALGQFIEVDYNSQEKIKNLYHSGIQEPLYTFDYHTLYTNVTDARGAKQEFEFFRKRLIKLTEGHRTQTYDWDNKGQLTRHAIQTPSGQVVSRRNYTYDDRGNILEMKLQGCMTKKDADDTLVVRYTYSKDSNRMLTENHDNQIEYLYSYYPQTNLLASKLTRVFQKVQEREFYTYDKNAILINKIVDDGSHTDPNNLENVTYRTITEIEPQLNPALPGMTLPCVTREVYQDLKSGKRYFLKKREFVYTQGDLLEEEKVYDSTGTYRYSLYYEYNSRREHVCETNALGESTFYAYDDNGNKIYEEKAGTGKKVYYTYDLANRMTQEKEEHEGRIFIKNYEYDPMGNCLSSTDIYGQKTLHQYDLASRETAVTDPLGYTELKSYDALGNITRFTDKDGFAIETRYNIYNKPLEILYPDGTTQKFAYNRLGHLVQEWNRDGTSVAYTVDFKGRILEAKTYSSEGALLKTLSYAYKGDHLIKEIDALGGITQYQYNDTGRKVAKIQGGIKTLYEYDTLGRLSKSRVADRVDIRVYDFLDRVIEERIEDAQGKICHKVQYEYDLSGNRTVKREFTENTHWAETKTRYNSQNLPVLETDPLGFQNQYVYRQTDHLEKESIDPSGRRTIEIYDPLQRLQETKIVSPKGVLLAYSRYDYDGRGNPISRQEEVLLDGKPLRSYHIQTSYDGMSQKIKESEEGIKITEWTYLKGRLHTIKMPDGVMITHQYDSLGRLFQQTASDGTIQYRYAYDLNDNLLKAEDLVNKTLTTRAYDPLNRMVYEKQATGLEFSYAYDDLHRPTQMSFCNGTVKYHYSPAGLISASRYNGDQLLYAYTHQLDWRGKIRQAALPDQTAVSYQWDAKGRCQRIDSLSYTQAYNYDAVGNLVQTETRDGLGSWQAHYSYDGLDQLIQETGFYENTYRFDSIGNRRNKNEAVHSYDTLNRLTHDTLQPYLYNVNGRRTSKGDARYTYDALGRLTSYQNGAIQISYLYDPLGRRIACITPYSTVQYLYQFDVEIGAREHNTLTQFRLTHKQATLAIELDGKLFTPIRNHRGDICQLLDQQRVGASYRYDAFGLFIHEGSDYSPWLFSGQRYDDGTQLYHFEKREYDPHVGQWLTPDPLGFADGPNLYAYVHNNPLIFVDPHGLWGEKYPGILPWILSGLY